jgi:hypothetical protein
MSLHPSSIRRERILLFGPSGAGKSSAWTSWADWHQKTGAKGLFYVMDTDRAWEAMRPVDGRLDHVIVHSPLTDWDDYKPAFNKALHLATKDDVLVVDMVDKAWSKAQTGFTEKAFGQDIDEFFIQLRKSNDRFGGDYGTNWQTVNAVYGQVMDVIQNKWPGHVVACAPSVELRQPDQKTGKGGDSSVVLREFGRIGRKPQGQKDLPHAFHTVLFMEESPSGWVINTAKERNPPGLKEGDEGYRRYLVGEKVSDFVRTYLFGVAGWKP